MTKNELKDHAIKHGCKLNPPGNYKADVIYFFNPKNHKRAWLSLPFNDNPLPDFAIDSFCARLGIPVPGERER